MPRDLLEGSTQGPRDLLAGAQPDIDISGLDEIGAAPELNQLSVPAFKASLGLLTTGDDKSLQGILQSQFGDKVTFTPSGDSTVVNLPSGQYLLNKPGVSGQDVARFVTDMLAFTPAGRAGSLMKAVGANAATQAGKEAVETSLGGDFSGEDVALAGAFGGAAKGLEDVVSTAYRGMKGSSANDVVEAGKSAGVPVHTSDVIPPSTFAGRHIQEVAEKIPLAGTGRMREAQQGEREAAVDAFTSQFPAPNYDEIVTSLKTQRDRVKSAAGSVLQGVDQKLDQLGEVPMGRTVRAIQRVRGQLSQPGKLGNEAALGELDQLIDKLGTGSQNFSTLKDNRGAFWDMADSVDAAGRSQLPSRQKAQLKDVYKAIQNDLDEFAQRNLDGREYGQWQKAKSVYADEATKLTKSRLKNVLDKGDVTPEAVDTLLFSNKPSEVRALYSSLTPKGRSHARSAIIHRALDNLSKRQSGISPNSFAGEMKKMQMNYGEFFKGEDRKALEGLLKALDHTKRAQNASVTTPTGQTLTGAVAGLGVYLDPTTTIGSAGTLGALAQLYESAPVRNVLLRIGSVPPGSDRFLRLVDELGTVANATAQAERNSQAQ